MFQSKRSYSDEISKLCNFLIPNTNEELTRYSLTSDMLGAFCIVYILVPYSF